MGRVCAACNASYSFCVVRLPSCSGGIVVVMYLRQRDGEEMLRVLE